jgi:3-deoxy-D-manno-octulosonic-acid transferase
MVLYNISIRLLYFSIFLAQFFNYKAKKWISGRKNWKEKLPNFDLNNKEVLWFHCASLGEFDQGLPLMQKLKKENNFLLVTFFSSSGFENYKKRNATIDFACYLPLDTKKNAHDFISHFKPSKFFIVKYEFWCNYIFTAKSRNVKIYAISAIFRKNQRFFSWYGGLFRKALACFDMIFVQNQNSMNLLATISISNMSLVGDLRFDKVYQNKIQVQKDEVIEVFLKNEKAFIVGSSWKVDELFLKKTIEKLIFSTKKIIIAPHDISYNHLAEIEELFKGNTVRYSTLHEKYSTQKILILDCIGKLANAYSYGDFTYVGGGFTGKLHNILEPISFELPVIFGPKHNRFPEAQAAIKEGIGFSISNENEIEQIIHLIQENKNSLTKKALHFVDKNKGVLEKIMNLLH